MFNSKTPVTIEPPAPAMPVSGVPGGPGGYGETEVHLLDRLSVIYRYRNVVIAVIIIVLIGGAVQTYTTTKEYRATAIIQIDPDRAAVPGLAAALLYNSDDEEYQMETELSRLKSHQLARKVATALDLANNPEFNGKEAQPTGLGDALLSVKTRLMNPLLALFRGSDAPATVAKSANEPEPAVANDGPPETPEEARRVELLMSRRNVERIVGTRLVRISIESRHREFATDAANAFARVYVDQNLVAKKAALTNKAEQAELTADKKRHELEAAKLTLQKAQETAPAGAFIDSAAMAGYVNQSRAQYTAAQVETATKEAAYNEIKDINLDDPIAAAQASPTFSNDQTVVGQQRVIQDKEREKRQLLDVQKLLSENSAVKAVQTEIDSTKNQLQGRLRQIVQSAKQSLDNAKISERRYRDYYEQQNGVASSQASASIPMDFFRNDVTRLQTSLTDIEGQREAALVEMSAISNNVKLMDRAQTPGSPFKPDPARNMLMALLSGFVVALALAFGLDYLDDTVKTPEDITRKLHVPFLGLVPSVRGEKQPVLSGPVPHDFGESYRALRTSLVFTSGGESTRVITVTSAQPLEGKTTTACNLAMVLAFGGSRVLLVDADMRRPGVHKALKISNTVGLSHLLVGQARVREAIQRTSDPNFCVMTAGRTPPNPSELLSSERMRQLVANLKQGPFDWVVIDTPPVLAVTDAIILTPLVDGVTFVVGAEMTRRRLAERAVQMIMASRPKVMGAVLNRVNFDRNKYYYSRYYGYQYKSYYGTSTSDASTSAAQD